MVVIHGAPAICLLRSDPLSGVLANEFALLCPVPQVQAPTMDSRLSHQHPLMRPRLHLPVTAFVLRIATGAALANVWIALLVLAVARARPRAATCLALAAFCEVLVVVSLVLISNLLCRQVSLLDGFRGRAVPYTLPLLLLPLALPQPLGPRLVKLDVALLVLPPVLQVVVHDSAGHVENLSHPAAVPIVHNSKDNALVLPLVLHAHHVAAVVGAPPARAGRGGPAVLARGGRLVGAIAPRARGCVAVPLALTLASAPRGHNAVVVAAVVAARLLRPLWGRHALLRELVLRNLVFVVNDCLPLVLAAFLGHFLRHLMKQAVVRMALDAIPLSQCDVGVDLLVSGRGPRLRNHVVDERLMESVADRLVAELLQHLEALGGSPVVLHDLVRQVDDLHPILQIRHESIIFMSLEKLSRHVLVISNIGHVPNVFDAFCHDVLISEGPTRIIWYQQLLIVQCVRCPQCRRQVLSSRDLYKLLDEAFLQAPLL
mmetsp:Transcript_6492/g.16720  ORF Transcript_6492/g.16720 Transcript_6492/m.16720 type:complete len:487 (-) Transcript_6492:131-1591(-)